MAAGAFSVLTLAGRRIPEDVAVVGFDDSPIATTVRPSLTSVRQPIEEMGQRDGPPAHRRRRGHATRGHGA